MRVLIIKESEIHALMARLELKKFQLHRQGGQKPVEELHRQFHYIVTNWVQEHGSGYPSPPVN